MSVRAAHVANAFYAGDPALLARQVDSLLDVAARELADAHRTPAFAPMALLPHAGHVYCGSVIAQTLVRMRLPERVIILCPNHTGQGEPLAVWTEGSWRTPLGDVALDTELASMLLHARAGYEADKRAHYSEHAIEVLLPFVQRLAPSARIVPIVVAVQPDQLQVAGEALAQVLLSSGVAQGQVSVLISSDMHHFGDEATTLRLDALALEHLLALDPVGLWNTVAAKRILMCGVGPATLALFAAAHLGIERMELVAHTTSAAVSGDTTRVVGYAGGVFWAGATAC